MMKASPGRIVIYRRVSDDNSVELCDCPAIVEKAHEDNSVCLTVFHQGKTEFKSRVPYSEEGLAGSWHWPPRVP